MCSRGAKKIGKGGTRRGKHINEYVCNVTWQLFIIIPCRLTECGIIRITCGPCLQNFLCNSSARNRKSIDTWYRSV